MDNVLELKNFTKIKDENHRKMGLISDEIEKFISCMIAKGVSEFAIALDRGDQEFILTLTSKQNETHA